MDEITFTGKKGKPFPIRKHPGKYFFISETDLKKLKEINEACKDKGIRHLKEIRIVGRGGVLGTKPFLLRAPEGGFLDGEFLCILAEHAVEFDEVRTGYDELTLKAEVKVKEEAEEKRAEVVRKGAEGKYVYCVISADGEKKSFGDLGIENTGEVYTIAHKEFTAVVSDSPMQEYEMTEENVRAHEDVVRKMMADYTVLPVAFNMVFKNKKTLLVTMNKARKALKKAYEAVDNKVELGVKAIFPKEAMKEFERGRSGKSREEFVKECDSDFVETLDKKAAELKKLKLFSDRLAFNAAFLVDSDEIGEFSEAVGGLNDKYQSLKVQYSGPWPPYNFVDIRILSNKKVEGKM